MVVTEVWATHVPMEVFCFQVKRKSICQDRVHSTGDVFRRRCSEVGRRYQRRVLPALKVFRLQLCVRWFHDCGPCSLMNLRWGRARRGTASQKPERLRSNSRRKRMECLAKSKNRCRHSAEQIFLVVDHGGDEPAAKS